jgi:hypothetical protein
MRCFVTLLVGLIALGPVHVALAQTIGATSGTINGAITDDSGALLPGVALTFYYDYGSFQEVSVNAAGNSADMAMPGVQFQFVSKSGGNRLGGSALFQYEHEHIQSTNIDGGLLARGIESTADNRLHQTTTATPTSVARSSAIACGGTRRSATSARRRATPTSRSVPSKRASPTTPAS